MNINELLLDGKYSEILQYATAKKKTFIEDDDEIRDQYDVNEHDVFDTAKRPWKDVMKPKLNTDGTPVKENGEVVYVSRKEDVTRVGMPYQKIIVARAIGFLLGNPVEITMSGKKEEGNPILNAVMAIWEDNKLDYKNNNIAEILMSRREVAEVWYNVKDDDFWNTKNVPGINSAVRPKIMILNPDENELYPVFDEYNDMIAFIRKYKGTYTYDESNMMDIYTAEKIYHLIEKDGEYVPLEDGIVPNLLGKIPVIYYRQETTEWYDVQSLIDQREKRISNLGDANDYFEMPILFFTGTITGFADKGERGKILTGETGASAEVLTWAHSPESSRLENEILEKGIYTLSQTPDLSFENMKGLGQLSGTAMRNLFFDAHLKARKKEMNVFGEGIQRRMNLLKAYVGNILAVSLKKESQLVNIYPVFRPYIPEDVKEQIDMLTSARIGGILSVKTALEKNPLVNDVMVEIDELNQEKTPTIPNESWNL